MSLPALLPDGLNTYAGLVVVIVGLVANMLGFQATDNEQLNSLVLESFVVIGSIYTLYGKARHDLPKLFVKKD